MSEEQKGMKLKQNGTGAMTTGKNDVFIGLQLENFYSVGEEEGANDFGGEGKKIWWGGGGGEGDFFRGVGGGALNKFLADGGAPHYPPVGKSCGLRS